ANNAKLVGDEIPQHVIVLIGEARAIHDMPPGTVLRHQIGHVPWQIPSPVTSTHFRQFVLVVRGIHKRSQADLFHVVHALDTLGFVLGLCQGWKKHGCEDSDNSDYHQKLDESESLGRTTATAGRLCKSEFSPGANEGSETFFHNDDRIIRFVGWPG